MPATSSDPRPDRPCAGAIPPAGVLVVAHEGAGSATRRAVRQALGRLAEGAPAQLRWTRDRDDLERALDELGDRLLVVAGGDGSLHVALDAMRRREPRPRVGLVPVGTGNDVARGAGLPIEPVAAAAHLLEGRVRSLPVLRAGAAGWTDGTSTGWVVNSVHLGLGAVAAARAGSLKPRLGRFAYPAAAAVVGLTHRAAPVRVVVDGDEVHDGPALAVIVLIGGSVGGGVEPAGELPEVPEAATIAIIDATPAPGRIGLAASVALGRIARHDGATVRSGRTIEIEPDRATALNVDGEVLTASGALRARWIPDAWELVGG